GTISPTSSLPAIVDAVEISGSGRQIELEGSGVPGGGTGLEFNGGSGSSVHDLTINRFFFGIVIRGGAPNTQVQGNFIGTNNAGTAALANTIGIALTSSASDARITGNVISGNKYAGIVVGAQSVVTDAQKVTGTVITGNYIGTNASGANLGNGATIPGGGG